MKRSRLFRLIQAMCTREDDPSKIDWPSVTVLLLYLALFLLIVFAMFWPYSQGLRSLR